MTAPTGRPAAFALAGAIVLVTASTAWQPLLGAAIAVAVLGAGFVAYFHHRLPGIFLAALGIGLAGYAFLGRGFAYLGYPPLFVGELLLVFGVVAMAVRGRLGAVVARPLTWPILAFMLIGAAGTLPHVGTYGLDALRDAVLWAYAVFALVVASLLRSEADVRRVVKRFRAVFPWFLVFVPAVSTLQRVMPSFTFPPAPFSDVPIVAMKGGDIAVHLVGILAFLILGLHQRRSVDPDEAPRGGFAEVPLWIAWLASVASTLPGRAAMLTVGLGGAALALLRPTTRWVRLGALVVVLVVPLLLMDVEIEVGRGRTLSPQGVVVAFLSIFDAADVGGSDFAGTRSWRLQWWQDIVEYTFTGPYFWSGKGYGINLANADGYQVWEDESLRSPHNGHLTVLARSGVPGLVAWTLVHVLVLSALLRAALRRRAEQRHDWERINLWLLVYWLAFLVNGSFDVFFEGPQGGIWFWSLVGVSLAALRVQGESARADAGGAGRAPPEG